MSVLLLGVNEKCIVPSSILNFLEPNTPNVTQHSSQIKVYWWENQGFWEEQRNQVFFFFLNWGEIQKKMVKINLGLSTQVTFHSLNESKKRDLKIDLVIYPGKSAPTSSESAKKDFESRESRVREQFSQIFHSIIFQIRHTVHFYRKSQQ